MQQHCTNYVYDSFPLKRYITKSTPLYLITERWAHSKGCHVFSFFSLFFILFYIPFHPPLLQEQSAPFLSSPLLCLLQVSEFSGKLLHKQFRLTPYLCSDRIRKSVSATTTTAVMITARIIEGSEYITFCSMHSRKNKQVLFSWIITNSEIRKPAVQITIILVSQVGNGELMKDVIQSM